LQCKENLNVGSMIESNSGGYLQTDNGVIEKYCYDNDPANCETYGGLYEWTEAMQYLAAEGTQGICPNGWHIPTLAEYEELVSNVGDEAAKLVYVNQSANAFTPTNETGFSALFGGIRYYSDGSFTHLDHYTYFWSSSQYSSTYANYMYMAYNSSNVSFYYYSKSHGFSVRCLKN
jgi:uncharacterized protein (TIGR02145 family)